MAVVALTRMVSVAAAVVNHAGNGDGGCGGANEDGLGGGGSGGRG